MRRYLSRRLFYFISLALFVVFIFYSLSQLSHVRGSISSEYFRHKEFLFNLSLAKAQGKEEATEDSLRRLLGSVGISPDSIYSSESGIEVRMKVPWQKLPLLLKEVERRYRIVTFSAVDNTGKGKFEVRMVVR